MVTVSFGVSKEWKTVLFYRRLRNIVLCPDQRDALNAYWSRIFEGSFMYFFFENKVFHFHFRFALRACHAILILIVLSLFLTVPRYSRNLKEKWREGCQNPATGSVSCLTCSPLALLGRPINFMNRLADQELARLSLTGLWKGCFIFTFLLLSFFATSSVNKFRQKLKPLFLSGSSFVPFFDSLILPSHGFSK